MGMIIAVLNQKGGCGKTTTTDTVSDMLARSGYSVLDIVKNFEEANGIKIPYSIKPRRPGDIATCYCDPGKAERELGWKAQYGIKEMCADSWRWQKNNPNGYED